MKSLRTKIGQLHIYDFLKGAFIAAIAAPLETLLEYLDKGELPFGLDWKKITLTFGATFLGYLIKQLLTGTTGKILITGKNTSMNFALRIEDVNDIVVGTAPQQDAAAYATVNGLTIETDLNGTLPNICYTGVAVAPAPLQMQRTAPPFGNYITIVADYVGPRPPHR